MTAEENKALARRFLEEVNRGNIEGLRQLVADDIVEHNPMPDQKPGVEGMIQTFTVLRAAFPDLRFEILDVLADGDKVVVHNRLHGTQRSEFVGMPAYGKQADVMGIDIVRIVDGKIREHWGVFEEMVMAQQLGWLPEA